jgi:AcrR family transcriptional regulator
MRRKKSASDSLTGRPTLAQSIHLEERLRQAAIDVFLDSGFEGAKMEAVAEAAGITKRTLYARYADKNALFSDVVVWATGLYHAAEFPEEIAEWDLATGLMTIARSTLKRAIDPDVKRLSKLALMESARIPDFSTQAYSTLWSPRVKAVADLLTTHQNAGDIVVDDIEIAAELFIAMVAQRPAWMALLDATRPAEMEESHLQQAVELFVRGIQSPSAIAKRSKRKSGAPKSSKTARGVKHKK